MVVRTAPDGARVDVQIPESLGQPAWYGITRLAGPRIQRDFFLAPVGQYQLISRRLMPGATERVFTRKGFDIRLYEAADRSDSCLVWVGPYHEATTWFGGAALRPDLLNRLIGLVRFEDSPQGAVVTSTSTTFTQQYGTTVGGWSDTSVVTVRSAAEAAASLPAWSGLERNGREVWRSALTLDAEPASRARGTAYEWRYVVASPTAVTDVVLRPAADGRIDAAHGERVAASIVDDLRADWAA